jgi:hypothetical protein
MDGSVGSGTAQIQGRVIQDAIEKVGWLGPQQVDQAVTLFRMLYFQCFQKFFAEARQGVNMKPPV